ncbi:hypothetical protein Kuura_028 [Caulobacter phage Kuura]|nr:hypothetical protein Kuura_028 [Caulobacter phage Kuura]
MTGFRLKSFLKGAARGAIASNPVSEAVYDGVKAAVNSDAGSFEPAIHAAMTTLILHAMATGGNEHALVLGIDDAKLNGVPMGSWRVTIVRMTAVPSNG